LNITRARRSGEVSAQAGNAFCAAATATLTSSLLAKATWAVTAPVAGLYTGWVRVLHASGVLACDVVLKGSNGHEKSSVNQMGSAGRRPPLTSMQVPVM
jgi:hypothetical protein